MVGRQIDYLVVGLLVEDLYIMDVLVVGQAQIDYLVVGLLGLHIMDVLVVGLEEVFYIMD